MAFTEKSQSESSHDNNIVENHCSKLGLVELKECMKIKKRTKS